MKKLLIISASVLMLCFTNHARAQFCAVRLNTLALLSGTLNAGIDFRLSDKLSFDIDGYWNPIRAASFRSSFLVGQAGVRFWRFEPNVGAFIGVHATGGSYDIGNRDRHYKGFLAGIGASYGYCWMLSKRWNVTAEVGVGCFYVNDTRCDYRTPWDEDEIIRHNKRLMILPSKAAVGFSYLF